MPAMCSADMYERALLTLTDTEWSAVESSQIQHKVDSGSVLDDPVFAALEAQVKEQNKAMAAEKGAG